jgi:hypothetical protein
MYGIDPVAGQRWLNALRAPPHGGAAADVVSIRPALRDAEDGSSELWAIVVLNDAVALMPAAQRRQRLAALETRLKAIMLGDTYDAVPGHRFVSFRTQADETEQARRQA